MPLLADKEVSPIGFGMMGLTMKPKEKLVPQEQAFGALKAALENGCTSWNGGEIYGTEEYNSLHLLNAYFTKYPEDADKIVLSIKGGLTPGGLLKGHTRPDSSPENIKRSIDESLKVLDGKKFLDLFECARVDPDIPIEDTLQVINEYVTAGKLGGISLSEVNANTIRRAAKVAKISAVEVEFSLWSTDILTNGIAAACAELGIPIVAYSPLGRGFLSGQFRKPEDLPEDDFRRNFPRFQGEAFNQNIKLVEEVEVIAKRKGITPGQVALAWIVGKSGRNGNPIIIPIPGASSDKRVIENSAAAYVELTTGEMTEIDEILKKFVPAGTRYPTGRDQHLEG